MTTQDARLGDQSTGGGPREPRRPTGSRSRADLPVSLPPRGLCRVLASQYVGVSLSKFDQLVDDGRMPFAKRIDGRKVWDRAAIDRAFANLPSDGPDPLDNPWDEVS